MIGIFVPVSQRKASLCSDSVLKKAWGLLR